MCMHQIMQIFNSLTSLPRALRLGSRWPQASSLPGRLCGSAARRLEALRRLRQLSLDFSLALILLVGIWRLIWGPCWNPFNTLCYTAPTGGDHVQHYYGWLAYARGGLATWLPPRFQSWTWPDPVPLLFADPIPLAAILLRPLARMLQIDFQYFSLLSLLSIVGSFLAGIWIGRFFALRSYQSTLLAVLLALAPPALLRLSGHEALSLHVVLVLALALVIRRRPSLALWLPLVVVSMGIHAYFTPMILGLGVYSQWACLDPRGLASFSLIAAVRHWLPRLAISIGVLLASAWLFGYLPNQVAVSVPGDMWSANLLALMDSQGKSLFFPALDKQEPLQWEGFSYLGMLGIVALCLSVGERMGSTSSRPERAPSVFPRPLAYGLLMLTFLLFSFGDQWFVGAHSVLHLDARLPLLTRLQQTFRSSGRFMWPVYYSLMIWGYVSITRATRFPRLLAISFLVLALESYWPNLTNVSRQLASHHKNGVKWERELQQRGRRVRLLRGADVLYNATGDPRFSSPVLPQFFPQAVNPTLATNYNAYLARYPKPYLIENRGSGCELVGRFLDHARGRFQPQRTLLIMRDADQASCPLTHEASPVLPLASEPPTSVFLLGRAG